MFHPVAFNCLDSVLAGPFTPHYEPEPANEFSTSKPHMSHLTLPRPRLELQDNGQEDRRGSSLHESWVHACCRLASSSAPGTLQQPYLFFCALLYFSEKRHYTFQPVLFVISFSQEILLFWENLLLHFESTITVLKISYAGETIPCFL